MSEGWPKPIRLHEVARDTLRLKFEADEARRAAIAKDLGLQSLPSLTADVTVKPWLDGAELSGRFRAVVEQICSVSLDPFEQTVEGEIDVRVVPPDSPSATTTESHELELALDAPDPPDVLASDEIDVGAYVVEHLALEIDPFPRKPGAAFEFTPPAEEESPFAVLKKLKDPKD